MTLKRKLLLFSVGLHSAIFFLLLLFHSELGLMLIVAELLLIVSLVAFHSLIKKGLQPLEYISMFSSLLEEQEFSSRFSYLDQPDLDKLMEQFNLMLQRLHQEKLSIGEQKGVFQKLMNESPIGVVLLDFDDKISDLNPAAELLLKTEKESVVKKSIVKINSIGFKYLKTVKMGSHKLLTFEQGRSVKAGHYSIRDRGFERSFYMLYEMTSEIIESQKMAYDKLIRLMSHEVNNTIATTNSLLESCLSFKEQLEGDSQQDFEQAVNIVINRSASLNYFMQEYANIVKLARPVRAKFNLTKLIKDLTFLFYAECEKLEITIEFSPEIEVFINADANLMEQVFINILKNAVEAIENIGIIKLEIGLLEEKLELSISDTGCGISKEVEQQLFTPFFTSKTAGQGVGLMLVRDILRLHEYQFSLQNIKNGGGACFNIAIPKSDIFY